MGCVRKIRLTEKTNPRLISGHHLGRQPIPKRRVSVYESVIFIVKMEMPKRRRVVVSHGEEPEVIG